MNTVVARFLKDESGATAIEYGLIAAIVAVGIIVGLQNLRDGLNTLFNNLKRDQRQLAGSILLRPSRVNIVVGHVDHQRSRLAPPAARCVRV